MDTVICNGVSINYRCVGEGRDVVLIHGLAANHAFWNLNILLPLARDYRVTVYDLRGHGYSGMPQGGYTSRDMAEDLHQLLSHLHIGRAHLIGHSFGGVVALHYAVLHPHRVSSLTIADSRVRALQPTNFPRDWPDSEQATRKLKELGLAVPKDETDSGLWLLEQLASPEWQQARHELKGSSLSIPFGGWNDGQRTAQRWLELLRTTAAKKELTSLAGLTLNQLSKINHPILAVYGEWSTVLPSFQGLRDLLPHCKSAIIPGAGHFYPLTRPKLLVSIISRFLKELERENRRRHERFPLTFSVGLRETGNARFPASTVNISKRGLLIKASRKLEIGSEVEVTKTLNKDGQSIVVRGRVVRMVTREPASDYRFGIELCSEDHEYDAWENFFSTSIADTQVVSP